jgi:hypothetical protein
MNERRPYIVEGEIQPGTGVVQGTNENQVKAPGENGAGKFIGVYPCESQLKKENGEHAGIVIQGPCPVLAGGSVTAGSFSVLKDDTSGAFVDCPDTEGVYQTCGIFLQNGEEGEYVDMLVSHGSVTIPST